MDHDELYTLLILIGSVLIVIDLTGFFQFYFCTARMEGYWVKYIQTKTHTLQNTLLDYSFVIMLPHRAKTNSRTYDIFIPGHDNQLSWLEESLIFASVSERYPIG